MASSDPPGQLRSPLLDAAGFRHAFFTREGGASLPPFDSLSFSASSGDDPAHVEENFRRAAAALGVERERLYVLSQVHGREVRALDGTEEPAAVLRERGDATASRAPGVACGVRVADCVPVLVADRASGAVCAIHSGWQGTEIDVAGAGVAALRELAGGPGDLVAAIGPCIEACCFEVGEDVAARLLAISPDPGVVDRARGPQPHVDLRRIVRAQLARAGVLAVDDVPGCTRCDPARFHSFRRDRERSGRHLAAIVAR